MITQAELNQITVAAEERKRKEHEEQEERIKQKTRDYCSSSLTELLKVEADKPTRSFTIRTTLPDNDGDVHLVTGVVSRVTIGSDWYNLDAMVEFIKQHGFKVDVSRTVYKETGKREYTDGKNITITW
jgi:hypothetical protein